MREIFSSPDSQMLRGGRGEGLEFLKAWAGTSLAFGIFISGGDIFRAEFLLNLLIAAATCGLGFVLHELAHRVVARNYGAEAHFFSNDQMLVISVLASFFFFIAAPGAVWHRGYLTPTQIGLVAIAGPVTNLTLALVFFTVLMSASIGMIPAGWLWFLWIGYYINAWLGLFNMIPVTPFDGGKVFQWNKVVYGITAAIALFMVFALPRIFGIQ